MGERWLILRTQPRRELAVERAIQEQVGLAAYVPKTIIKRRHPFDRRKVITVRSAIYGGYVFSPAHFPVEQINTTKLSAHWMRDGDKLAQISDKLMDMIEAGERIGCAIEEAIEALRCAPITKRMMKRERFSKDVRAVLGRAA
jgi:hypothetical protein